MKRNVVKIGVIILLLFVVWSNLCYADLMVLDKNGNWVWPNKYDVDDSTTDDNTIFFVVVVGIAAIGIVVISFLCLILCLKFASKKVENEKEAKSEEENSRNI